MIERGNSNPARTKIPCASIWSATSSTRDIAVSCSSASAYLSMSISRGTTTVDSPWTSCGRSPVSSSRCVQAPYYPLFQQSYKHLPNVFVGMSISVGNYFSVLFRRLSELLRGTVVSVLAWGRHRLLCLIALHISRSTYTDTVVQNQITIFSRWCRCGR